MSSLYPTVNIFFQKRIYGSLLGKPVEAASLSWCSYQGTNDSVLKHLTQERPLVAVVSCEWLGQGANELIASIRHTSPLTHVVLCCLQTPLPAFHLLNPLLMEADPDTFCHISELTDCLRTIQVGQSFVSTHWDTDSLHTSPVRSLPGWHELSRQEQKIIGLMVQGLKGPDIADNLFISEKTVNNHKLKISQKLRITGGPGSLTRFVLTERQHIFQLLDYQPGLLAA